MSLVHKVAIVCFWLSTFGCSNSGLDTPKQADGGIVGDASSTTDAYVEPDCAAIGDASCFYVATDGDDSATGAIDAPFLTFHAAIEQAGPGDFVYARGGTYGRSNAVVASMQRLPQGSFPPPCATGQVAADGYCQVPSLRFAAIRSWDGYPQPGSNGYEVADGEPGNPITFRNFPGELPILDFNDLLQSTAIEAASPGKQRVAISISRSHWRVSGFEIMGGSISISSNISDIIINDCDIHDLTIDGYDDPGLIRISLGPEDVHILNNRLHGLFDIDYPDQWFDVPDFQHFGAITTLSGETYGGTGDTGSVEIRGNEIYNVSQVFFFKNAAAGPIDIVDNHIYESGALASNASANVRFSGNLIRNVKTGIWRQGLGSAETSLPPEELAAVLAIDGQNLTMEYNTIIGLEDTMMQQLHGQGRTFWRNLIMGLPGTANTADYNSASMFKTGTNFPTIMSDENCYVVADEDFQLVATYGNPLQHFTLTMAQTLFGIDLNSMVVIETDENQVFKDPINGDYTPKPTMCMGTGHTAVPTSM